MIEKSLHTSFVNKSLDTSTTITKPSISAIPKPKANPQVTTKTAKPAFPKGISCPDYNV